MYEEAMKMITPSNLKQIVKMFKRSRARTFSVSNQGRVPLNADTTNQFVKVVSRDNNRVAFRKIELARPNVFETASKLYNKHADLMKRLEKCWFLSCMA